MLISRLIKHGEKIREPGCYDMPISWYHGQPCDGPSVSSSGLRTIFAKSPAHFWLTSSLNPDRVDDGGKPAFSLGRAAHHLLLGQEGFDAEFAVRPEKWRDWRTNDAKEWRAYQESLGKTILTPDDLVKIEGMRDSLARHPLVRAGILNGAIERSLVWQEKSTGLWVKSRPDSIPQDSDDPADLKTTTSVDRDAIERTIGDFGYHMQASVVGAAFKHVLGRKMESFNLVFVEKEAPFSVRVVTLKDEDIALGAQMNKKALMLMRHCLDTGRWPGPGGYSSDAEFVEIKPWARTQAENRIAAIEMELEMAQ